MLKKYFLWASLSALGLAGCSRSERTPATAGAPGAASSVPPAVPAASQLATEAPAPAPAATSAETTRLLALLGGPRRHDTTLAPATPDEPANAAEALAPDSARTAEVRRYLQAGLPAAQVFTVQPGRDTLLLGAQGTQVLVPAHAWDLPDSTAEVHLTLREFYTPADIILAGLSTTSGTQLLETGGMVHLVATAKGQPVDLLPNRPVLLRFPTRRAQPDMQLFEGIQQGPGRALDWQMPAAHGATTGRPAAPWATTGRRAAVRPGNRAPKLTRDSLYIPRPTRNWPVLKNFQADMAAQVRRQLPQPKRLRRPFASRLQKNFLTKLVAAYNQRTVHRVSLRFTIDSAGTVSAIEPLPGSDFVRNSAAVAALRRLGRWQPATVPYFGAGQVCTEAVAAQGHATVLFSREGGVSMTSITWVLARASRPRAQQRQHEVRELLASPAARRRYLHQEDSVTAIRQAQERAQWAKDLVRLQADEARLRTQFTDTSRAAITQAGVYNELWTQGLNWINCDRFTKLWPLITCQVRLPQRDAVVSLVFQELNSVMQGVEYADGVSFIDVPRRQRATVVALRRENGVTYLAKQLVQLTKAPLTELRFHPVTMAQLRAELAQP